MSSTSSTLYTQIPSVSGTIANALSGSHNLLQNHPISNINSTPDGLSQNNGANVAGFDKSPSPVKGTSRYSENWRHDETKHLIKLYGEHREYFESMKRNASVWERLHRKMLEAGFNRSAEQCRNRWKTLERKYKEILQHNSQPGNSKKTDDYFEDMNAIRVNRASVPISMRSHPIDANGISIQSDGMSPNISQSCTPTEQMNVGFDTSGQSQQVHPQTPTSQVQHIQQQHQQQHQQQLQQLAQQQAQQVQQQTIQQQQQQYSQQSGQVSSQPIISNGQSVHFNSTNGTAGMVVSNGTPAPDTPVSSVGAISENTNHSVQVTYGEMNIASSFPGSEANSRGFSTVSVTNAQPNSHQNLDSVEQLQNDSHMGEVTYTSPQEGSAPLRAEKRKLPKEHTCEFFQFQQSEEYLNFLRKKHQDRMEYLKQKMERRERHREKKIQIQERQMEMMAALLEFLKR